MITSTNLSLKKTLKLHNLAIVGRSVFQKDKLSTNFFRWMLVRIINFRV